MNTKRPHGVARLLGPSSIVGTNLALEFGSQFLRTVILARMLSTTEFGIVMSLSAFVAIVEMSTSLGLGRYLVFTPTGSERANLGAVHAVTVIRGLLLGVLVWLAAAPTADALGQLEHSLSYAAIGLVPLLRGFQHFDVLQMQRDGRFWPFAVAEGSAALAGLVASVVAALIVTDHRAILWGLGAQVIWVVAATHVLSRNRYRISLDPARIGMVLKFGLPLMINGLALAAASQFDRMIVGIWLGVAALGVYGLAITLVLQPISLVLRLAHTVLQPALSAAWHADPKGRFPRLTADIAMAVGVIAGMGACGVVCLGTPAFRFVFGSKFVVTDAMFVTIAFIAMLRLGQGMIALVMLACGRTKEVMYANLAGCLSCVLTFMALVLYPSIDSAMIGLLGAVLLSFVTGCLRGDTASGLSMMPMLRAMAVALVPPGILGGWVLTMDPGLSPRLAMTGAAAAIAVVISLRFYRQSLGSALHRGGANAMPAMGRRGSAPAE